MRKIYLGPVAAPALLFAAFSPTGYAQTKPLVEARLAAQDALFKESWETNLRLTPTQATAVGDYRYNDQLGERAKAALGPHFDLKIFHDEVLSGGALPLDVLDARVNRWILGQLPATAQK